MPAAALLPGLRLVAGGREAFHGQAQIGAEAGLRRVEALEEIALQGGGEKALRQVLGVFVALAEFVADEFVDRLPVERRHALQRQWLAARQPQSARAGWKESDRGCRRLLYPHRATWRTATPR